ncbi:MAG: ABC transporter substrate-binding protein, partial [Pyrinomonadaceae bacterium]|nr:ABC transporter substrate-binding protein [Pyrinomonadaceae bacterium]
VLADANALQAELLSGRIDLAPNPTNLAPDTIQSLGENDALKVETFDGSNVQYIGFNFEADPVNKTKVRQAVAYAINRKRIISDQLNGNATLANSILPAGSWAYSPGTEYEFDMEKAKKLLDEAGYKDTDGDGVREMKKIIFKISSGSKATQEYAVVMESQLKKAGIPISIESLEGSTMREQVKQGQFIMTTGRWVGGNQDPIFLHDLFATTKIPRDKQSGFNRWRFTNKKVDDLLDKALKELDREKAKEYFVKAQELISKELPLFPLWYSKNVVISKNNVGNIQMNASGDWDFVRKMTVE